MHRFQSFEFNERSESPKFLRDSLVEILGNAFQWGGFFRPAAPIFLDFCQRAGCRRVLDLCSGSGEPVSMLMAQLDLLEISCPRFLISDLHPNLLAMERVAVRHAGRIQVIEKPVDATNVPQDLDCRARTIINGFHHFPPPIAVRILKDCVAQRQAIFILEGFPREFRRCLAVLPFLTTALVANPFLTRSDRGLKTLFSFFLPIIPAVGVWDTMVSVIRMYTREEFFAMTRDSAKTYHWAYHEAPFFPGGRAVIFTGIPR